MGVLDLITLLGGLGLFLYGMQMMGDGLELAAGSGLKTLLSKMTNNRFKAVLLGLCVTALIQSSSATSVMVVSFVNAQLMTLTQAVGVIMGANIGTTITGQIIALNTSSLAYILACVGGGIALISKNRQVKSIGSVLIGLAILFIGMKTMSAATEPLRDVGWFKDAIVSFKSPIIGILVGVVFTAIIQSSSASVGILQAFALQGLIGLDSAVFVILGQNIGTCVTALISAIGTNKNARRAALIHLMDKIIGMLIFVPIVLCTPFVDWMIQLTPVNPVRQIANTHTVFNIVTTLLLLPFIDYLVALSHLIIRGEDTVPAEEEMKLEFVDERIIETPTIAVSTFRNEIDRMCSIALRNLDMALGAFISGDLKDRDQIIYNEKLINFLNKELTRYLARIGSAKLSEDDLFNISAFHHVISDIERIGDHAENIIEYAQIKVEHNVVFSELALTEVGEMRDRIDEIITDSLRLFDKGVADPQLETKILIEEENIDDRTQALRSNHIQRLNSGVCSPESGMMFVDMLVDLERVGDHAFNIAYSLLRNK